MTGGVHQGPFHSLWHFADRDVDVWIPVAEAALAVLSSSTGFVEAHVGRNVDEPGCCFIHTTWVDVGSYRRALSSTQAKISVWPFLADMQDAASAFESLLEVDARGSTRYATSVDGA